MERLRVAIHDNELHYAADELRTAAECYEEQWSDFVPPPFVAAFIDRHQPRPDWSAAITHGVEPDEAIADASIDAVQVAAARLALLIMRGALANNWDVRADAYLVADPNRLVTPGHAARILAQMPKPIECRASVAHGYVVVRYRTIVEPTALAHRGRFSAWRQLDGVIGRARTAHGEGYGSLLMYCEGAGESITIPLAAAELFDSDYDVHPIGLGVDTPQGVLARDPGAARTGRDAGAAHVLTCSHAAPAARLGVGEVIGLRRGSKWPTAALEYTPGVTAICERCGAEVAQWLLTDADGDSWPERKLGPQCAAAEVAASVQTDIEIIERQLDSGQYEDMHPSSDETKYHLERLERPWQRLPMPAMVSRLIARIRALRA
jgi:hypothetical protein